MGHGMRRVPGPFRLAGNVPGPFRLGHSGGPFRLLEHAGVPQGASDGKSVWDTASPRSRAGSSTPVSSLWLPSLAGSFSMAAPRGNLMPRSSFRSLVDTRSSSHGQVDPRSSGTRRVRPGSRWRPGGCGRTSTVMTAAKQHTLIGHCGRADRPGRRTSSDVEYVNSVVEASVRATMRNIMRDSRRTGCQAGALRVVRGDLKTGRVRGSTSDCLAL